MPAVIERIIGHKKLIIETGKLAAQAHGAVTVRCGDTVILATAVMADKPRPDIDFLPLTVEYEERLYSAGKIPGSFFRREGRPGQEAILSARLIDRPIRPLFPKELHNDIQIIITVLSVDMENPPEVLGILGASAALSISHIPFNDPIGASRVAYVDGQYIVNPTYQQTSKSSLNLVVASTRDAIMMVEAGSDEVSEEVMLKAIHHAHEANRVAIDLIDELTHLVGKPKQQVWVDTEAERRLEGEIKAIVNSRLSAVLEENPDKIDREATLGRLEAEVTQQLSAQYPPEKTAAGFKAILKGAVQQRILEQGIRPDGRSLNDIRPITCEVGLLPRTHGSGLFTRGLTQVLSIATLASMGMKQMLDTVGPEDTKRYMHHYNFPPYSTGEAKRMGTPGRREIGHGALAERAILPTLPSEEEFPYTIRVVSEVLSSNGSTSMGSVCGSTLALMDAGVPIKAPVAGVAMGLVTREDGRFAILTDIQGTEDALGDMDFKVAGTAKGINALQMDIKVKGLNEEILRQTLEQARIARLYILEKMRETIHQPRQEISPYAPKMLRLKIPVEKIGALIGPGGRVIRSIIEETGASIDVEDDGTVTVGAPDQTMMERARSKIEGLTRELVVGDIFTGKITRITSFGAFVELLPGREGLVRNGELGDTEDEVEVGREITVVVQEIDSQGRLNLSRRALFGGDQGQSPGQRPPRSSAPPFTRGGQGGLDRGRPRFGGSDGGRGGPSTGSTASNSRQSRSSAQRPSTGSGQGFGGDRGRRPGLGSADQRSGFRPPGPDRRPYGGGSHRDR